MSKFALSLAVVIACLLCVSNATSYKPTDLGRQEPSLIRYEAEESFHFGKLQSIPCNQGVYEGFSSSVNHGATLVFTVNIPKDGIYPVNLRYTHCEVKSDSISVKISANGLDLIRESQLPAPVTTWADKEDLLELRTGLNTIEYKVQGGNIAMDYITVTGGSKLAERGATTNFIEYQAELAKYSGAVIGPDKTYTHLASEATGRKAVQLTQPGDYVEFSLTQPANAVVIRYSVPDSPTGTGTWALLTLSIDGTKFQTLNITSVYSWCYGPYPSSKHPGDGQPHHFFDDVRLMFGRTLAAGSKVRVEVDSKNCTIDVADFYTVPDPYPMPAGYHSVVDYGADPTGGKDSLDAFKKAIAAAKGSSGVWIPAGKYSMSALVVVDQVIVRGAGPWYTEMHGNDFGFFGGWAPNPSTNVKIYDLAIFGRTITRDDMEVSSGAGGALTSTIIQNIWIEHNKCGMWLDGPFHDLLVTGVTIRNTFADGINFHKGVQNSVVEQTIIRNSGDDCLAMWPEQPGPYGGNTFKFNTLSLPILANTIAIYGGDSNSATDNIVSDTLSFGAGVQIGVRFSSVALSGTTTSARNTLYRTGSTGYGGPGYGAIWLFAENSQMSTPIVFTDHQVYDSYYSGIQFYQGDMTNIVFTNITIDTADFAIEERTQGSATFNSVVATNLKTGGQWNCGSPFKIILGTGNTGWSDVKCTPGK